MGKRTTCPGFSLVELLVVAAIVMIVAALAVAAYGRVRQQGDAARCLANLRAIGMAAALYSNDHEGRLPQSSHQGPAQAWQYVLPAYVPDRKVFRSPLSPDPGLAYSYALNDYLTARPYGAAQLDFSRRHVIEAPAATMMFALVTAAYGATDHFHFAESGFGPAVFSAQVATEVIARSGHYLFVDGHVERMPWETLQKELDRPGSRFVRPDGKP